MFSFFCIRHLQLLSEKLIGIEGKTSCIDCNPSMSLFYFRFMSSWVVLLPDDQLLRFVMTALTVSLFRLMYNGANTTVFMEACQWIAFGCISGRSWHCADQNKSMWIESDEENIILAKHSRCKVVNMLVLLHQKSLVKMRRNINLRCMDNINILWTVKFICVWAMSFWGRFALKFWNICFWNKVWKREHRIPWLKMFCFWIGTCSLDIKFTVFYETLSRVPEFYKYDIWIGQAARWCKRHCFYYYFFISPVAFFRSSPFSDIPERFTFFWNVLGKQKLWETVQQMDVGKGKQIRSWRLK